jgi:hypothetical protein
MISRNVGEIVCLGMFSRPLPGILQAIRPLSTGRGAMGWRLNSFFCKNTFKLRSIARKQISIETAIRLDRRGAAEI